MWVNPNTPEIIAITKKTNAQRSMVNPLLRDIGRDYASDLATAIKNGFGAPCPRFNPEKASPPLALNL
jgi:hypothetical protein